MSARAGGEAGRLASLPARPSRSLSARPPTPAPVRVSSYAAATVASNSSVFPERADPPVTRLTVYRITHLRWDGTKWAYAGYHESRYYLTRRAAQRKADQLAAAHPEDHRFVVEPRS
jgi:hypothetical protein